MSERIRLTEPPRTTPRRDAPARSDNSMPIFRSASPVVGAEGGTLDSSVADRIEQRRGSGSPIPDATRTDMESKFGHHFEDVRIHTSAEDEALARAVGSVAFTTGSDI